MLRLEKVRRSYGVNRRQVEIVKLRGSAFREGFHDYTIETGGLSVYPRLIAAEHGDSFPDERVKSGIRALDSMFGGGISRGSSTLITGPTGAGKSTLAAQYAAAAAARGERALIFNFDEVLRTALDRSEALGIPLRKFVEERTLRILQVDPAECAPGELAWIIRREVETNDVRVLVIDSLNGFLNAMPGERDLTLHLHELLAYLSQKGVITFIVLSQHGLVGNMQAAVDVSYLADTVILLRYFEAKGSIREVISVLKQRVGVHERTLREFHLDETGIVIGEPLSNFSGVLTGVPEFIEAGPGPFSPRSAHLTQNGE